MKKHPEVITVEWLKTNKACPDAIAVFIELFPKGTRITLRALEKFESVIKIAWMTWLRNTLFDVEDDRAFWNYPAGSVPSFWHVYTAAKKKAKKSTVSVLAKGAK